MKFHSVNGALPNDETRLVKLLVLSNRGHELIVGCNSVTMHINMRSFFAELKAVSKKSWHALEDCPEHGFDVYLECKTDDQGLPN